MSSLPWLMSEIYAEPAESHTAMYTGFCDPLGKIVVQATFKGLYLFPANVPTVPTDETDKDGGDKLVVITWSEVQSLVLKSGNPDTRLKIKLKQPLIKTNQTKLVLYLNEKHHDDGAQEFLDEIIALTYVRKEPKWWACLAAESYRPRPETASTESTESIASSYESAVDEFVDQAEIQRLKDQIWARSATKQDEEELIETPCAQHRHWWWACDALAPKSLVRQSLNIMSSDA